MAASTSWRVTAPLRALADDGAALVRRAAALYGPNLLGVVVFGSWARGEAGAGSDVDLLVGLPVVGAIAVAWRAWRLRPSNGSPAHAA